MKHAEHAKLLADQVEESAKRKLKILEKSLDLEKEKIENEAFEARSKAIVAEYESKLDERDQVSNDNSSGSSSGHRLLAENILQNENIDNHTSLISESYIRSSNVYNETSENISINSGENIDNKKLKVTKASNPKTRETNILIH